MTATRAARRSPADKHDARRDQLAESALRTLGELGYARASLREIATNSEFSHGVVHYYFRDKLDLIVYCVRYYKASCVTRYDAVVEEATSAQGLLDAFAAKLVETLSDEAPMHRLWYDLRTQSMFEAGLRDAVALIDTTLEAMIWRVVERYAELSDRSPALTAPAAYGVLDGLFQNALLAHQQAGARESDAVLDSLVAQVRALMPLMLAETPAADPPA